MGQVGGDTTVPNPDASKKHPLRTGGFIFDTPADDESFVVVNDENSQDVSNNMDSDVSMLSGSKVNIPKWANGSWFEQRDHRKPTQNPDVGVFRVPKILPNNPNNTMNEAILYLGAATLAVAVFGKVVS